jgi:hypothetical protein
MLHKTLLLGLTATLLSLLTAGEARAWGAIHVGYTHVGYGGVYHYGRTAAVGPYGAYYGGRTLGVGGYYGGLYHTPYYGGEYLYPAADYAYPYSYGGIRTYGLGGVYQAGVYRAW